MINFKEYIKDIPDFPKKGIIFKDISPLLENKFSTAITTLGEKINWNEIDLVVGIESRGFIFGSALAAEYKKGFVPMRKKGKLPPPVIGQDYELEYGTDRLELRKNENNKIQRILLVDDVLATGGTLKAAMKLCTLNNFNIAEIAVLIDLTFLNKFKDDSDITLRSLIEY